MLGRLEKKMPQIEAGLKKRQEELQNEELKKYFISSPSEYREGAVHVFRQKFAAQNVKSAVLYMTALGIYDVFVNGKDVQEQYFAPGYTYYPRDLFYQKMDVTDALQNGENELKVYLAQGWYCGRFTFDNKIQIYGNQPAVSWVLQLETADGKKTEITSSADVTELTSPYGYAGFYDGEIYDATTVETETGKAVPYTGAVPEHLEETFTKVRLQEEMPVRAVMQREDSTILDFGQNFAGVITIDPEELPEGTMLTIRHGEI
jgi:alpha-L-rhamnosidase